MSTPKYQKPECASFIIRNRNILLTSNKVFELTLMSSALQVTQDDSGGLEVLGKNGSWIKADPVPNSFMVNIADCFMCQTNDFFVSTVHRVINKSGKERYSAPFFFGFDRQ